MAEPRGPTAADFRPIVLNDRPIALNDTLSRADVAAMAPEAIAVMPSASPRPISDFAVEARSFAPRPVPAQPNSPKAVTKSVGWGFRSTGHRADGSATWYCKAGTSACAFGYPGGMYAAAGPELRVGAWRGRIVRVCSGGPCVVVKLIDWCACGGSHVIDLYSDAFRRLAPLSSGALTVTVSW
jgi:rare lipoprotein A (peptidoglycan hydrolase)